MSKGDIYQYFPVETIQNRPDSSGMPKRVAKNICVGLALERIAGPSVTTELFTVLSE